MLNKDKPLGVILYEGPSMLDGSPIVVIAVGWKISRNGKTGNMVQTYIIRSDMKPTDAIISGADSAVCGNCPLRGDGRGNRLCYVTVGQGPLIVFKSYIAGKYRRLDSMSKAELDSLTEGRMIRLGTYGDPAAAPVGVWRQLTAKAAGWTGYTHQWRESVASALRPFVMASADTEADAIEAHKRGWRTFRVAMPKDNPRIATEAICPASAEAGYKLTCATCKACNGTATNRKASIVIQAHGGFAVMAAVNRVGTFAPM